MYEIPRNLVFFTQPLGKAYIVVSSVFPHQTIGTLYIHYIPLAQDCKIILGETYQPEVLFLLELNRTFLGVSWWHLTQNSPVRVHIGMRTNPTTEMRWGRKGVVLFILVGELLKSEVFVSGVGVLHALRNKGVFPSE
eukprot:TRINITY_DN66575_c4_g1_i1.p1 TRINITY_DN66575_c4_g1~~TRINITY_DN66575_c4_g1_i1.p1  ORF type:complete len:137 (-),score=3.84 TRINITY_DN66575_c4_g1_i1:167-577(-)